MVMLQSLATGLLSLLYLATTASAHSNKREPLTHLSLVDDATISTASHRIHAYSHFDLLLTVRDGNKNIRLALEPNHDLLHPDFAVSYLGADGKIRETKPVPRETHRVYKGFSYVHRGKSADWSRAGTARITIHQDGVEPVFDGVFRIDGNTHHVQTVGNYLRLKNPDDAAIDGYRDQDRQRTMVVWRDSDLRSLSFHPTELKRDAADGLDSICDAPSLSFNQNLDRQMRKRSPSFWGMDTRSLFGRQSIDGGSSGGDATGQDLAATIGSTTGCPTTRKVALVGIATDCTYWNDFDKEEDLRKNVISMVNQASEVYENTFKLSLGIQNLTISDKACPGQATTSAPWNVACSDAVDLGARLSLFSAWRGQFTDDNAYWTLLSMCNTQSAVGLSWRGQLCRSGSASETVDNQNETVAGANVVVRTDNEWQVFAHETGHTFGAVHDCTSATCPESDSKEVCCPYSKSTCDAGGKYIMNPASGSGITEFSPCSIGNICSGLTGIVNGKCLTDNKNIQTITGAQCGNGIVESGEDCDCGGDQACQDNACCDPDTCKFKSGAVCDPTNEDCCSDQCQYKSSDDVCRASTGECDIAETCPGDSAKCPDDQHKDDGDSCGDKGEGLKCASGHCTSRDDQCRNMMSGLGVSNITGDCDADDSCALVCHRDNEPSTTCVSYNQNFLDGTSCGAGGKCRQGKCEGSSTAKEIGKWITEHKSIFIPLVGIVGGLILLAIVSCIWTRCRRRSRVKNNKSQRMPPPPPPMMQQGWAGDGQHQAVPYPAVGNYNNNRNNSSWGDTQNLPPHMTWYPPAANQWPNDYQNGPDGYDRRLTRGRVERWG